MFEHLKGFNRIWVSGPQRSGTRFCSRVIAEELELRFIDEAEFSMDKVDQLRGRVNGGSAVVQCPGLCHLLQALATADDCVVMMIRDITDIHSSERRIKWNEAEYELKKYRAVWGDVYPEARSIAELKYLVWLEQRELIPNWQEVYYESLSAHARWLPKEARRHFGPYQTD